MLNNFARSVLQSRTGYLVYVYSVGLSNCMPAKILENVEKYPMLTAEDIEILKDYTATKKECGHGCFTETGWLYDAVPHLVRLDRMNAVNGESNGLFDGFSQRKIYTPFSWMGNYPGSLSATYHPGMNERIARVMAERAVEDLAEVFKFLKEETVSREYYKQWAAKNPLI